MNADGAGPCRSPSLPDAMAATTATQRRELAFAGVARQAEIVRAGEVTPRELVETALERIAALDPQLNAFRVVFAERALLEADQAGGDARGGRRPAAARRADRGQGRHGGRRARSGCAGPTPAARPSPRTPSSCAGCALRARSSSASRARRSSRCGRSPRPRRAGSRATRGILQRTPGGSSGGSGAAVAAGARAGRDGLRRRRLDPHPGGLLRAVRAEGPSAAGSRPRRWQEVCGGLVGVRLSHAQRRRRARCCTRSRPASRTSRPREQDPPHLRIALSMRIPPGISARLDPDWRRAAVETAELLRSLGHEVVEREPAIGAGRHCTSSRATSRASTTRRGRSTIPSGSSGARERMARLGARGAPAAAGASAPRSRRRRARQRDLRRRRRRARPDACHGAAAGRPLRGPRRGVHAQRASCAGCRSTALWNHIGNPAAAVPAGFDADGLPLSVQLVGRPHAERTLFSLAAQLEARPALGRRAPAGLLSTPASAAACW